MVLTDSLALAERARILRAHGMSVSDLARHQTKQLLFEEYPELGYNYRLTDMQAAIGIEQLRRLDGVIERRRDVAQRYAVAFAGVEGLRLPPSSRETPHTYQSYMIELAPSLGISREAFMQRLLCAGVATRRGVMAIHLEPYYRKQHPELQLPVTEFATAHTVLLPVYATMTADEQEYVIEHVLRAVDHRSQRHSA